MSVGSLIIILYKMNVGDDKGLFGNVPLYNTQCIVKLNVEQKYIKGAAILILGKFIIK